ncbi:MAG: glycosyltransferase family 4 protein [Candidatus Hodarchaeota archaeon]
MRIMLQNHTFYPMLGGIENYLYHVSKVLQRMGHQPIILCEKHDQILSDFEAYDGINIVRHPYYSIPKRKLFSKPKIVAEHLNHFISKHIGNIDFVISRYPHYCFATTEVCQEIPIFYIPPSVFWKQLNKASSNLSVKVKVFNYIWRDILDEIEKESIQRSRKTVVFSKNNADSLMHYYGLKESNFKIIAPGVKLNRFDKERDLRLLEELNIHGKAIVLLYVGRLPPEKNVDRLLKEFRGLERNDVKLLIVGDGSERRRLEKKSGDLGLEEKVIFLGIREDVERFYSIADIFISPSKYEPFGQVILEAMASGLPCVAFKRMLPEYEVAADEIIEDAVTGYCVNPYERDEFRQRLLYLIDNPDIRNSMGEAGRKVCQKKFTWEDHVRKLLGLMNN